MREVACVIAVACLVGCADRSEQSEKPDWSVRMEHFAVDGWVSAFTNAVRTADGSFTVAVHAPGNRLMVGEQMLEGSQVVRVSADGDVLGVVAAEGDNLSGGCCTQLRADEQGNTILLWDASSQLASYDADLKRTWARTVETDGSLFDVSAQGAIALVSRNSLADTATIHWLHSDGTIVWEATQAQILGIRFAANSDLFVFGAGHRWRYDSAGNIVDDITVRSGTTFVYPDGGWLYAKPTTDSSELDRYDSTGQLTWSRTYPYQVYDMHVSATGSLLVRADVWARSPVLLAIDDATGNEHPVDSGCVWGTLVAADAEHCVVSGGGLSQFKLP